MATLKREVEFAKEIDDVMFFVVELVKDLKAKKAIGEVAAENLANLMNALNGIDLVDDEMKAKSIALATIGYRSGELAAALLE